MDDLTTAVALYGAVLSSILLIFQIYSYSVAQKEKKPKIDATLRTGLISEGQATSDVMLYLEVANSGHVPVTLTTIPPLVLPDGMQLILTEAEKDFSFPHTLAPGTGCNVWREIRKIARELSKNDYSGKVMVTCQFKDALDNSFRSKPFPFDVDEWTKQT